MKKAISIVLLNLFIVINMLGQSSSSVDSIKFLTKFALTVNQINTISYKVTSTLTKIEGAIPLKKNFILYAKRNSDNWYNFDWELDQIRADEFKWIQIHKNNNFYIALKNSKLIAVEHNLISIDEEGSYTGAFRNLFLPDELIYNLPFSPIYESTFSEDDTHYLIETTISKEYKRIVYFNKSSFLPEKITGINVSPNLNTKSTISFVFSDFKINPTLPDSILSPGHYVDQGYKIRIDSDEKDKEESSTIDKPIQLNNENIHKLLDAELSLSDGSQKTIRSLSGDGYLLLDFWYISCGPCLKGMPKVEKLYDKYKNKGLTVYGVNGIDFANKKIIDKKMKEKGVITFPSLYGPREYLKEWNINAFPTYLLLDKNGEIVSFEDGRNNLFPIENFLAEKFN